MASVLSRLAVVILLLSQGKIAAAQVVSGIYDNQLHIALDQKTGVITGYYESHAGLDEKTGESMFSCIFYLQGRAVGKQPYRVKTWFPDRAVPDEVIEGKIEFGKENGQSSATLTLDDEHGGCWNVQHFADHGGATFMLDQPEAGWSAIRVVSSKRAYFHEKAQAETRRKAYLTTGDAVGVSSRVPGWVYVMYINGAGKVTMGWIKEADLFPSDPPAKR